MSEPIVSQQGVVGVLIRQRQLLVIRRSRFVVAPGMLCFPGGEVEAGESEPEALRREMREELGIAVRPVVRLWRSVTPWNVALAWWYIRQEGRTPLNANRREVESVHWFPPHQLRDVDDLLQSNHQFLQAWQRGEFRLPTIDRPA